MSSSTVKRKLLPAKHACKKLATFFRSKLLRLKRSKAYKRTASRLNAAVSTMLGRRRHPHRFRLKKGALPRLSSDPDRNRKILHHHHHYDQQHGFVPVYVDDLFAKPAAPLHTLQVDVQPAAFVGKVLVDKAASGGGLQVAGAEEEGSSSPVEPSTTTAGIHRLEGVDLRAELFIAKFKEEMWLQRQRSFGEQV